MTAKKAKNKCVGHIKYVGVYRDQLWDAKAKRKLIRLAKDLFYDLIDPEICLKIERAGSEIEAERLLMACRHAM